MYSANVNSSITDKLRCFFVISKQTHLFSDIFECCFHQKQMSVQMKIKNNTQQKNWEISVIMKSLMKKHNFFVDLIENTYFPVDLAFDAI